MSIAVFLFLFMHLNQIKNNTTSNEASKWSYVQSYYSVYYYLNNREKKERN